MDPLDVILAAMNYLVVDSPVGAPETASYSLHPTADEARRVWRNTIAMRLRGGGATDAEVAVVLANAEGSDLYVYGTAFVRLVQIV